MKERGWGTRSIPALLFQPVCVNAGSFSSGLLLFVHREVVLFHLRAHAIERVVHIV
jgi:hypothetical protein